MQDLQCLHHQPDLLHLVVLPGVRFLRGGNLGDVGKLRHFFFWGEDSTKNSFRFEIE